MNIKDLESKFREGGVVLVGAKIILQLIEERRLLANALNPRIHIHPDKWQPLRDRVLKEIAECQKS